MARLARYFFALLFLLFGTGNLGAAETLGRFPQKVLILLSGHDELPWQASIQKGIEDQLAAYEEEYDGEGPDIHIESLDLFRHPATEADGRLAEIASRYTLSKINLLLTEGIPAARLVEADETFYPLEVVYAGHAVINFNVPGVGPGQSVDMAIAYDKTVEMMNRLMPNLRRVVVVGNHSAAQRESITRTITEILGNEPEIWSDEFSCAELLDRASKLGPDDAIMYSPVHKDRTGATLVPFDVARELSSVSAAPVFSSFGVLLGSGIVGGHLWSGELLGRRLIQTAFLPTLSWSQEDFYFYGFDKAALDRFGMKRKPIPDGAVLLDGARIGHKSWTDTILDPIR